jgi:hypothetical protein
MPLSVPHTRSLPDTVPSPLDQIVKPKAHAFSKDPSHSNTNMVGSAEDWAYERARFAALVRKSNRAKLPWSLTVLVGLYMRLTGMPLASANSAGLT